jgi:hypothetical protein
MSNLGEAVARYHRILESENHRDLGWAAELHDRMKAHNLTSGNRPISPVLRPHFISKRQYTNLVRAAEALHSAIDRVETTALTSPQLLARMQMLPAEKMLAAVDPGYSFLSVTALLDTHLNNGTLRFVDYNADTPAGVAFGEALNDEFYDVAPMKEFRRKYSLTKVGGTKYLLAALIKAYKEFGGRPKARPHIAIVEFRQPFQTAESSEFVLLADFFRREGFETQVVSPEQLEYRNGVLRHGDFTIDLVYRRIRVHEFLVRFDLSHPLVRAYRDRSVCVVNSFRSEVAQKKAIFDLLTDDSITASFPAAERKAIKEFIPWTRVVSATQTNYGDQKVDLPEFILRNRQRLILKPNDPSSEFHSVTGSETDEAGWERALRQAMRTPYVVQEAVQPFRATFPVYQYGSLQYKDLRVDVQPHAFLGKVHGCSTWISAETPSGFTTISGLAPTFLLEPK